MFFLPLNAREKFCEIYNKIPQWRENR